MYGIHAEVELKVPGKKADPIQEYVMELIHKAHGYTAVCHSVKEVRQFIDEIKRR
jgi:hypothetical protein